jgi:hypothetical protein
VWYSTQQFGALCPFGYGQTTANGPVISGNGLSIFKNPSTMVKTLVLVFSAMNAALGVPNAVKIGINSDGTAFFNPQTSPMQLNRMGFDGARFLNPMRPADLYISSFQFNAFFIKWATPIDPKIAVQVVQFSPAQLHVNASVPVGGPTTLKYCSPSAGPIVPLSAVAAAAPPAAGGTGVQVPSQSNLQIKLYNSPDCNPLTTYSTASDPAALNLQAGTTNPINIPYQSNACNNYIQNGNTRSFKMRCLAGGMSNGIYGARTYMFKDFTNNAACMADSQLNPNPLNTFGSMTANMMPGT